MKKALCIMSGGMDSTLCAYIAKSRGYDIVGLHFDYKQRTQAKEKECFEKICANLEAQKLIIDASFIADIGANSLTDTKLEIPTKFSDEVPNTYVPFRNGIFVSIAAAVAEKFRCEVIYIGVIEVDGSGYPDCSAEFINSIEKSINLGRVFKSKIEMPLVNLTKEQIVIKSLELGVKLEDTWSCYKNSVNACGVCDSCRLRLRGFKMAGATDKIPYVK
ncbi:MAG: 7-cyano-7-deazaguanine synthase QueC [Campylobacter sp.]|nr:7-cyano-7-deazaguanine synthase QueC [Campylobacter sp.]